jgi:hypothetical protein
LLLLLPFANLVVVIGSSSGILVVVVFGEGLSIVPLGEVALLSPLFVFGVGGCVLVINVLSVLVVVLLVAVYLSSCCHPRQGCR